MFQAISSIKVASASQNLVEKWYSEMMRYQHQMQGRCRNLVLLNTVWYMLMNKL